MLSVNNLTRQKINHIPCQQIATKILGQRYDLSIAFIGYKRSRTLNRLYRKRDYATDVLAFPLSATDGEIFIDLRTARRKAKKFDHQPDFHIAFLLIHACLHLKGHVHGSRMEHEEKRLIKALKLNPTNEPSHRHRSRYRDRLDQSRGLRIQTRK